MPCRVPLRHHIYISLSVLFALAIGSCGVSVAAANPELAAAKRAYTELEFRRTRAHLERALRWGKSNPSEMREILRLSGETAAAVGKQAKAEDYYYQMLTLDPSAELPAGLSPKLTAPFEQAKKKVNQTGGLTARCRLDDEQRIVRVHIDADPAGLVAGARAVYRSRDGDRPIAEARAKTRVIALALQTPPKHKLFCAVIDRYGNHLVEVDATYAPPKRRVLGITREPSDSHASPQPFFAHYLTWGTLGTASTTAGVAFAWRMRANQNALDALNQDSSQYDFAAAQELARSGRRNARMANLSFAFAGACAVVTVVQYLRRPTRDSHDGQTALISPMFTPDGAGVAWSSSF